MTETMQLGLIVTDAAKTELKRHLEAIDEADVKPGEKHRVRIEVVVGGCAGFKHLPTVLDPELRDGDIVRDYDGIEFVADPNTVPFIEGATFDFIDTFEQRAFKLINPNAQGSCACGSSFG